MFVAVYALQNLCTSLHNHISFISWNDHARQRDLLDKNAKTQSIHFPFTLLNTIQHASFSQCHSRRKETVVFNLKHIHVLRHDSKWRLKHTGDFDSKLI